MPYKIVKRGKDYILKSPTREYKHKSLAKAKAQRKLLEEKEVKQKQSQKQKQVVIVNVHAPKKAAPAKRAPLPKQLPVQEIRMIPSITPFGIQEQIAQARPQKYDLLEDDRIGRLEKSIEELREPFLEKQEQFLKREPIKGDNDFLPIIKIRPEDIDTSIFEPRVPVRTGITRKLTIDSVFNNATIGQLLQGDYGETTRGPRTEPTKRQEEALRRWREQNP